MLEGEFIRLFLSDFVAVAFSSVFGRLKLSLRL